MISKDYATAKYVRESVAEVNASRLRTFANRGWVRTVKLGDSQQAARLYHLGDVRDVLDRMSRGRLPKRARRQSHGGAK